jgi:hypothetical protein
MDILDYILAYDIEIGERQITCCAVKFAENVIVSNANPILKECVFKHVRIIPHKHILIATLVYNDYNLYNTKYTFTYKKIGDNMLLIRI